jgi:hypothetical protein
VHVPAAGRSAYPDQPDDPSAAGQAATAVAIPYFQWDNRDGGPMRVWLPVREPSEPDRVPRPRQIP